MRFYRHSRTARITLTALLTGVGLLALRVALHGRDAFSPWLGGLMIFNAVFQVSLAWSDYWEVGNGAIVQHSLFYRKHIAADTLRYAGPVRQPRLSRSLKKAIELDVTGLPTPLRINADDRRSFLQQLAAQAPEARVIQG